MSQKIATVDLDMDSLRLERFCRIGRILAALLPGGGGRRAGAADGFRDPIVPGFLRCYLRHSMVHAAILAPYLDGVTGALGVLQPALVIASDESSPFNQLLFEAAARQQIPAVSVQHGELTAAEAVGMHTPMGGDFHLVRPGGTRDFFVSRGMASGAIAVYANLCSGPAASGIPEAPAVKGGPVPRGSVPIFIAGTALGISEFMPVLRNFVRDVLALIPDAALTFRPHPSESVDEYVQLLADERLPVRVVSGRDPLDGQIAAGGCAVVFSSSLALDLALKGVPTVICNFSRWPLLGYLHDMFTITYSPKETAQALFEMVHDERNNAAFRWHRERFLRELQDARQAPDATDWWSFFRRRFSL